MYTLKITKNQSGKGIANSRYNKYESDEMYEEFNSIINDMNISPEEKYRLLAL